MKILFVCTGNTCRSAMCEGIFKKLVEKDNITVLSAGINAFNGAYASEDAIETLKYMNIDISNHSAKRITMEDIEDADLIITMTDMHKMIIINSCPNAKEKTFTLCEYATGEKGQINDPYGMGMDAYKKCAEELKKYLEAVKSKLK